MDTSFFKQKIVELAKETLRTQKLMDIETAYSKWRVNIIKDLQKHPDVNLKDIEHMAVDMIYKLEEFGIPVGKYVFVFKKHILIANVRPFYLRGTSYLLIVAILSREGDSEEHTVRTIIEWLGKYCGGEPEEDYFVVLKDPDFDTDIYVEGKENAYGPGFGIVDMGKTRVNILSNMIELPYEK